MSRERTRTALEAVNRGASTADALARHLVTRATGRDRPSLAAGSAVQVASERTCRTLSRSLGAAGFHALLARALAQAQPDHAPLAELRVRRVPETVLGGLPELVEAHGSAAVDAALTAMLVTLLELLGRLIGDDMVARLVDHDGGAGTGDEEDDR